MRTQQLAFFLCGVFCAASATISAGCLSDEGIFTGVNLFDLASDDRLLEFELDLGGRGDHLVQVFSDMSAQYLMSLEVKA